MMVVQKSLAQQVAALSLLLIFGDFSVLVVANCGSSGDKQLERGRVFRDKTSWAEDLIQAGPRWWNSLAQAAAGSSSSTGEATPLELTHSSAIIVGDTDIFLKTTPTAPEGLSDSCDREYHHSYSVSPSDVRRSFEYDARYLLMRERMMNQSSSTSSSTPLTHTNSSSIDLAIGEEDRLNSFVTHVELEILAKVFKRNKNKNNTETSSTSSSSASSAIIIDDGQQQQVFIGGLIVFLPDGEVFNASTTWGTSDHGSKLANRSISSTSCNNFRVPVTPPSRYAQVWDVKNIPHYFTLLQEDADDSSSSDEIRFRTLLPLARPLQPQELSDWIHHNRTRTNHSSSKNSTSGIDDSDDENDDVDDPRAFFALTMHFADDIYNISTLQVNSTINFIFQDSLPITHEVNLTALFGNNASSGTITSTSSTGKGDAASRLSFLINSTSSRRLPANYTRFFLHENPELFELNQSRQTSYDLCRRACDRRSHNNGEGKESEEEDEEEVFSQLAIIRTQQDQDQVTTLLRSSPAISGSGGGGTPIIEGFVALENWGLSRSSLDIGGGGSHQTSTTDIRDLLCWNPTRGGAIATGGGRSSSSSSIPFYLSSLFDPEKNCREIARARTPFQKWNGSTGPLHPHHPHHHHWAMFLDGNTTSSSSLDLQPICLQETCGNLIQIDEPNPWNGSTGFRINRQGEYYDVDRSFILTRPSTMCVCEQLGRNQPFLNTSIATTSGSSSSSSRFVQGDGVIYSGNGSASKTTGGYEESDNSSSTSSSSHPAVSPASRSGDDGGNQLLWWSPFFPSIRGWRSQWSRAWPGGDQGGYGELKLSFMDYSSKSTSPGTGDRCCPSLVLTEGFFYQTPSRNRDSANSSSHSLATATSTRQTASDTLNRSSTHHPPHGVSSSTERSRSESKQTVTVTEAATSSISKSKSEGIASLSVSDETDSLDVTESPEITLSSELPPPTLFLEHPVPKDGKSLSEKAIYTGKNLRPEQRITIATKDTTLRWDCPYIRSVLAQRPCPLFRASSTSSALVASQISGGDGQMENERGNVSAEEVKGDSSPSAFVRRLDHLLPPTMNPATEEEASSFSLSVVECSRNKLHFWISRDRGYRISSTVEENGGYMMDNITIQLSDFKMFASSSLENNYFGRMENPRALNFTSYFLVNPDRVDPPETISQAAISTAKETAVIGSVVGAVAGNPAVAVQASRTALILNLANCEAEDDTEDGLSFWEHPIGADLGGNDSGVLSSSHRVAPWAGASFYNPVFVMCCMLLHALISWIAARRKAHPLLTGCSKLYFPGIQAVTILPLLQPTAAAITTIFRQSDELLQMASGAWGSAFILIFFGYIIYVTTPNFGFKQARWKKYPKRGKGKRGEFRMFLTGPGEYQDNYRSILGKEEAKRLTNDLQISFVKMHGLFFDLYGKGKTVFAILEVGMTIVFGILEGWRPETRDGCKMMVVMIALLLLLMCLLILGLRPYVSMFEGGVALLVVLLQLLAMVSTAVYFFTDETTSIVVGAVAATGVLYLLTAKAVVDLIIFIVDVVYLQRADDRKRKRNEGKKSSTKEKKRTREQSRSRKGGSSFSNESDDLGGDTLDTVVLESSGLKTNNYDDRAAHPLLDAPLLNTHRHHQHLMPTTPSPLNPLRGGDSSSSFRNRNPAVQNQQLFSGSGTEVLLSRFLPPPPPFPPPPPPPGVKAPPPRPVLRTGQVSIMGVGGTALANTTRLSKNLALRSSLPPPPPRPPQHPLGVKAPPAQPDFFTLSLEKRHRQRESQKTLELSKNEETISRMEEDDGPKTKVEVVSVGDDPSPLTSSCSDLSSSASSLKPTTMIDRGRRREEVDEEHERQQQPRNQDEDDPFAQLL